MYRILIAEDDSAIGDLIDMNLRLAGYDVMRASTGGEAIAALQNQLPNLALLDIMLPDIDGFALLDTLKPKGIPVIFITARSTLNDKVKGLAAGADDYIVKPFEPLEMLARVDALLRRAYPGCEEVFALGDIQVRMMQRTIERAGVPVMLTVKEFDLLQALIQHRNQALSRDKLLAMVWGYDFFGETRTVDIHIQRLRKKLGWEDVIRTVYKMGYRLEVTS